MTEAVEVKQYGFSDAPWSRTLLGVPTFERFCCSAFRVAGVLGLGEFWVLGVFGVIGV